MKNCFLYQDGLKAYSDGELSPLRHWVVRRHLMHCASCREEIVAMTQITEDLRASEPEDTLSPTLREKLLEPGTGSAGLLLNESRSATPESLVPEALSLDSSPALPVPGPRKRRLPAWTFAALALVAWFVCYPIYQHNLTVVSHRTASPTMPPAAYAYRPIKADKPLQVAQTSNGPAAPERPVPPADMPDVPAPLAMPMSVPPPPPKPISVHAAAPMVARASREAHVVNVAGSPNAVSVDGSADTLNGDPDSLRQVHKEAGIGLQVPDPDATGDKLNDMVKETGGYVAANNLTTDPDGRKSGELIVKVPEAQFETFLAAVAKLGTVVSKNITGQDITEQTSDAHEAQSVEESDLTQAEARLKSLGSHAKWEDKEDTQDQRVRLAQTRARLKMLKRMAALGTITIDLSQPAKAAALPVMPGFTGTLQATTHDALQSLAGSASALLALVIWILAYSPIWVPLTLLGRYALKEYRKREAA